MFAKDRRQTTDLCAEGGSDMLGTVRNKIFDASHDIVQECVPVDEGAETRNLTRNRRPHLSLVILEQLNKRRNQISRDNLLINRLGNLWTPLVEKSRLKTHVCPCISLTFSNLSAII